MRHALQHLQQSTRQMADRHTGRTAFDQRAVTHTTGLVWKELDNSARSCYCCDIPLRRCRGCFEDRDIDEAQVCQFKLPFHYLYTLDDVETESSGQSIQRSSKGAHVIELKMFATCNEACMIPDF